MATWASIYWWLCGAALVFALLSRRSQTWQATKAPVPSQGDYFASFRNALSREECARLRDLVGRSEAALVGGGLLRENVRAARLLSIDPGNAEYRWLFERLWGLAMAADFGLGPLWELEALNLLSYAESGAQGDVNGHYDWHADLLGGHHEGRLLSLSIQLSHSKAYRGGELIVGAQLAPRGEGQAVVFPSYLAHSVYPVLRGERCALVAWVRGRLAPELPRWAMEASLRAIEDEAWKTSRVPVGLRRIYGAQLLHGGQPKEAALVLRRVAGEDPHSPGALNDLAIAEYRQGHMRQAIDALLYSAHLRPHDGEVQANLGRFFYLEGRLPLGTYHLAQAVRLWHRPAILMAVTIMTVYCGVCGVFWCLCLKLIGWPQPRERQRGG